MIAASTYRRSLSALLASTLLVGCTMAPRYERPAAPVATAYPATPGTTSTEAGPTELVGWRQFFQDPLLQELVGIALANNRDLRVAAFNAEAARAQYRIQRAELAPSVAVNADASAQRLPEGLFYNRRSYQVGGVVPAWELDLWGRLRNLSGAALARYLALEETQNASQMSLVAQVANAYLALRADQALLALTADTLAAQQRSFDLTQQRFEAGGAAQLDLERAKADLQGAQADHAVYQRLAAQDRNGLVLLLGQPLSGDLAKRLDAAVGLSTAVTPGHLPAGLPSELLARRPDVRAAEQGLRAANANIGAARAAFFPSVTLTGSAGTASARLDDLFGSDSHAWSFAPRISLPIFNAGALRASLDRAQIQKRIEVATYEKAVQSAFRDVADGLAGQGTLQDQVRAEELRVAAARKAYQLAEQRYREGEDDNLALLDAQRAYYGAQQGLVRAQLARQGNLVDLYKALGGGWDDPALAASGPGVG